MAMELRVEAGIWNMAHMDGVWAGIMVLFMKHGVHRFRSFECMKVWHGMPSFFLPACISVSQIVAFWGYYT